MRFISPKTDFVFKKIFGSEQSHDVPICFLNALLYDGKHTIAELEILNPYLAPRIRDVYDLELVFIELPKFHKAIADLETLGDKWLYFLKHARDLDIVPESN